MITVQQNRIITNQDLAEKDDQFKKWFFEIGINPFSNNLELAACRRGIENKRIHLVEHPIPPIYR